MERCPTASGRGMSKLDWLEVLPQRGENKRKRLREALDKLGRKHDIPPEWLDQAYNLFTGQDFEVQRRVRGTEWRIKSPGQYSTMPVDNRQADEVGELLHRWRPVTFEDLSNPAF